MSGGPYITPLLSYLTLPGLKLPPSPRLTSADPLARIDPLRCRQGSRDSRVPSDRTRERSVRCYAEDSGNLNRPLPRSIRHCTSYRKKKKKRTKSLRGEHLELAGREASPGGERAQNVYFSGVRPGVCDSSHYTIDLLQPSLPPTYELRYQGDDLSTLPVVLQTIVCSWGFRALLDPPSSVLLSDHSGKRSSRGLIWTQKPREAPPRPPPTPRKRHGDGFLHDLDAHCAPPPHASPPSPRARTGGRGPELLLLLLLGRTLDMWSKHFYLRPLSSPPTPAPAPAFPTINVTAWTGVTHIRVGEKTPTADPCSLHRSSPASSGASPARTAARRISRASARAAGWPKR